MDLARNGCITLLLLTGLTACTSFDARPISAEANAARLADRTLADPGLRAFIGSNLGSGPAGDSAWRWDLESLTLAAFYFQPELDVARAQWAVAEAGKQAAAARPAPLIDLAGGSNSTTADPSPNLATAGVQLPLQPGGKRGLRIAEAAHLSDAAHLNILAAAWQLRSRVRAAYMAVCAAMESQSLLQSQQQTRADYLRILEGQYRAGSVSGFDFSQARLAAATDRLALHEAMRVATGARSELAAAVGIPASALEAVKFPVSALDDLPPMPDAAEAHRQALLGRADILGALSEYAATQSALQLEIARQFPDISIGPGYEYDQGDNKWSLGLSIALPAGRNQGAIAVARARRQEVAARFTALQAGVLQQVDLAMANYADALSAHADAFGMLTEITAQRNTAGAMFEAGTLSRGDLAALELQLGTITQARLNALLQAQQAAGQLELAMQGPLGLPDSFWDQSPGLAATDSGEEGT